MYAVRTALTHECGQPIIMMRAIRRKEILMCAKLSMPLPLYYHRGIFRVEKLEIPPRVDGICPFPFDQTSSSCRSSHAALLYAPAAPE